MHAVFNTVSGFLADLCVETQPNARIPFELVVALCGLAMGLVLVANIGVLKVAAAAIWSNVVPQSSVPALHQCNPKGVYNFRRVLCHETKRERLQILPRSLHGPNSPLH
jgi:hypothetical protein